MSQPQFDSAYIFGIYEPGGEHLMLEVNRPGWILFSEVLGHNPNDRSGKDYTPFADQGLAVMTRLNNGYHPQGTIPFSGEYANFARRCANFVAASRGCRVWIIGNETNYAVERPGAKNRVSGRPPQSSFASADPQLRGLPERFNAQRTAAARLENQRENQDEDGEVITPDMYARCYRLCRDAIHRVAGHETDRVLMAAVAPWNTHTTYNGNPSGDWIKYFQDILLLLGPSECDGITLHTYTHGADPSLIQDDSKLLSFPQHHYHFQSYRDFMQAIPHNMRHLPVYITETDQVAAWQDVNRGWIQTAYREIDEWNRKAGNQKIRSLILYRWPQIDQWHMEGKRNLIDDFRMAVRNDFRWEETGNREAAIPIPPPPSRPAPMPAPPPTPMTTQPVTSTFTSAPMSEASEPAYRVQWLQGQLPRPLTTGQTVSFPVTLRNAGAGAWTHTGSQPVRLGYRFYQNRQEIVLRPDQQIRSALPSTVQPGESVTFDARIKLPDIPGNYTLQLDLIHEGVTWFADQQSDVLTRWLTIGGEPLAPPAAETAPPIQTISAPALAQPAPAQIPYAQTAATGGQASPINQPAAPISQLPQSTGQAAPILQRPQPEIRTGRPTSPPIQPLPAAQPLTPPAITDISASLPKGSKPWESRPISQVRHLIINHTGAPPRVPVQAIAQAHVDRGYPGITYDFYINQAGQIFQVSPLEAVAKADAEWSGGAINICLEGNFDSVAPPAEQLDAAAQICAWMLQRTGLQPQNIIGLCEILQTSNPGDTFLTGPMWKKTLVNATRQLLESATPPTPAPAPTASTAPPSLFAPTPSKPPNLIPQPPIQDIVARLSRDPSGFFSRRAEEIQYLVINHTAAPADIAVEVIASAFRDKLPGILYQYFITADGQILQTQPMLQVVDGQRTYIANAVNIAFAGDFSTEIPTSAQIQAGSHLIAWLLGELPQLTLSNVRGVSEFIPHSSPGDQWLRGRRWKDILLNGVADRLRDEAAPGTGSDRRELQRQLREAQQQNETLLVQVGQLRRDNSRLTREIEEIRADPNRWRRIAPPQIHDISSQLPRHVSLRYEQRRVDSITHLAIHHTAMPPHAAADRIAAIHIEADPERGKEAWPGIGYHFFVHGDGRIDQTQPLESLCYHVAGHNPHTVGVAFAGSFMNGTVPTPPQLRGGARLLAWLMQELKLPLQNIWGHKEFSGNRTTCPGSEWSEGRKWRDMLFAEIVRVQSGGGERPVYHYLLFAQKPHPGPVAGELSGAHPYIERFRPSVGFRVEEAIHARYVTIVGGPSGISSQEEDRLRQAGAQVERIDGQNETGTIRILRDLVQKGQRFQGLVEEG